MLFMYINEYYVYKCRDQSLIELSYLAEECKEDDIFSSICFYDHDPGIIMCIHCNIIG